MGQVLIKKVFAYSSVFRAGWLVRISSELGLPIVFLRVYALGLLRAVSRMEGTEDPLIWELVMKKERALIGIAGLLRIGGVPPLVGFYAKILVLVALVERRVGLGAGLAASSVFVLAIYVRAGLLAFMGEEAGGGEMSPREPGLGRVGIMLTVGGPFRFFLLRVGVLHKKF